MRVWGKDSQLHLVGASRLCISLGFATENFDTFESEGKLR